MKSTVWVSVLTLWTVALLGSDASAGQFKHVVYYHAGQRPYQVVTAQLTNSGNIDLVVANYATSQVVVLPGKGDGTFQNPMKFQISAPVALAVGDFNGDGNEDLVVVEYGGTGESAIAVLLGDGTGKFRESGSYPSGVETTGVAVADFNGDGHVDVAVANNTGDVMVFFGTGKGTLKKPRTYKLAGTNPYGIAASDLSGDGHPDLAVAEAFGGSVAVLMNDGTGKFLKPVTYNAGGGEVVDVKIADLNHDGMNDLAAVNGSKNEVAILLNRGDGSFKAAQFYPTGSSRGSGTDALVIADFNLDGKLDIAAVNSFGDGALLYGNGNGTFQSAIPIKAGVGSNSAFSIAAGDFNNDGAPDLAVPIEITGKPRGKVAILLNTK